MPDEVVRREFSGELARAPEIEEPFTGLNQRAFPFPGKSRVYSLGLLHREVGVKPRPRFLDSTAGLPGDADRAVVAPGVQDQKLAPFGKETLEG